MLDSRVVRQANKQGVGRGDFGRINKPQAAAPFYVSIDSGKRNLGIPMMPEVSVAPTYGASADTLQQYLKRRDGAD